MIFNKILQLNYYAVPELPLSRNPLHNCIIFCNSEETIDSVGAQVTGFYKIMFPGALISFY